MPKPLVHAEIIKAWADGYKIQKKGIMERWIDDPCPGWYKDTEYRVKPAPKPDIVGTTRIMFHTTDGIVIKNYGPRNVQCWFDAETHELKKVELVEDM